MRPALKYHGGKGNVYDWVISNFPVNYEDRNYYEPFIGAGSVYLNELPSATETIGDINKEIFYVWAFLKMGKFKAIRTIKYTEDNFKTALEGGFGPLIS